jgi:hypothetical protein
VGVSYLFRGLRPFERRLIHLSCIGIIICLYLLRFHNFSNSDTSKLEKEIGYLSAAQSDIRIKNFSQTLWQAARQNQKVREGDKVYTGDKSFALINLKNDSKIELKENSLVEFKRIRDQNLADLSEGQYRVSIVKGLKVAINGKVANFEGNSEIILNVGKDKKVSIQTLEGAPKIQFQAKTYSPTKESTIELEPETPEKLTEPITETKIRVSAESKTYEYYLKLYDVYERSEQQLKKRSERASLVRLSVPLTIETFDSTKDIFVKYSQQKDLGNSRQTSIDSIDRQVAQVFIGDNYWQCSQDEINWTPTAHFHIKPRLLPDSKTRVNFSSTKLILEKEMAETTVELNTNISANGYLVESSRKSVFDSSSIIYWSYEDKIHLQFNRPGTYFYRFRAVDEDLKLGEWSETTQIDVIELPSLAAPRFAMEEYKTTTGQSVLLSWTAPDDYKNYKIKIYSSTEDKLVEKVLTDPFLRWTPKHAGNYYAEVSSIDPYKRLSPPGRTDIEVKGIQIRLTNNKEKEQSNSDESRDVASQEEMSAKELEVKTQYQTVTLGYNADFILSRLTFSTNYYDGYNSKALTDANIISVATPGIQAAALGWMENHGAEAIVQKNLTSNEPGAPDFYSAELRYHYRFYDGKDRAQQVGFHLSPFLGYETLSNSNDSNLLSGYNMLKLGFFMEVPIMQRWTMGLTGGYGTGDSLTKYEAAWDVSYFFKKQWTMGVGIKTNLVFGTNEQFPSYPDYREGYSLGQFNLRYFF